MEDGQREFDFGLEDTRDALDSYSRISPEIMFELDLNSITAPTAPFPLKQIRAMMKEGLEPEEPRRPSYLCRRCFQPGEYNRKRQSEGVAGPRANAPRSLHRVLSYESGAGIRQASDPWILVQCLRGGR